MQFFKADNDRLMYQLNAINYMKFNELFTSTQIMKLFWGLQAIPELFCERVEIWEIADG